MIMGAKNSPDNAGLLHATEEQKTADKDRQTHQTGGSGEGATAKRAGP